MIANQIAGLMGVSAPIALTDYESIATVDVTAGGGTTAIDFTAIAGTYKHLQIRAIAKGGEATYSQFKIQFNSDTGANYSTHAVYGTGSGSGGAEGFANYSFGAFYSGSTTNFGAMVIDVLDYSNTNKYKTVRTLAGVDGNGSGIIDLASAGWRNTNAITSIKITTAGTGTIAQYSHFALYGIK
jgi:hypothetical protein